ncbi:MAG: BMC domain-containing protein [Desulfosarcinaceae bacterium]|nr:BMC domain-containing protein [Desulfosarcinaceae bacterium]
MADNSALGFVEAYGMVAAIEAADAMVKAARVKVKTVLNADVGMLSVICEGDLAACKAAVDAGKAAADAVGKCLSTNLIPRPGSGIESFISKQVGSTIVPQKAAKAKPKAKGARRKGGAKK